MPETENVRTTAKAIGLVTCINTGTEIGLLYQWDNGETQAALYDDGMLDALNSLGQQLEPNFGVNRCRPRK